MFQDKALGEGRGEAGTKGKAQNVNCIAKFKMDKQDKYFHKLVGCAMTANAY